MPALWFMSLETMTSATIENMIVGLARKSLIAWSIGCLFILGGCQDEPASKVAWAGSLVEAAQTSRAENRLIMMKFYADWCGPCKDFDRNTLTDPQVLDALRDFVPFKIDADSPEGQKLSKDYGVSGLPTIIFTNSGGIEVLRIVGGYPPPLFLEALEKAKQKFRS